MELSGNFTLPFDSTRVFEKLSDARFLVDCIPGNNKILKADAERAECKVKPGFTFAPGSLNATMERAETEPGKSISWNLFGKGIGMSNELQTKLTLSETDGTTVVHWQAEFTKLGGLLKAVPQGLIQGAAQKVIDDVWKSVLDKMTSEK